MLELQENIAKVQSATVSLRRNLVDNAAREYFVTLDLIGSPTAGDFDAAEGRANAVLKQELLSANSVALVNGGTPLDENGVALVALSFDTIARPLRVPATGCGGGGQTLHAGPGRGGRRHRRHDARRGPHAAGV